MSTRTSFDQLVNITGHAESRNRDYDAAGRPVRSPKGALYRMQTMPTTAGDPGYGVRPARNSSPEEFNRVGRDYLAAMLKRYGSMDKAWAAYNGGPGRLDRALAGGGDWLRRMPPETRKYVANNMKSLKAGQSMDEDEIDREAGGDTGGLGVVGLSAGGGGGLGISQELMGLQKEIISSQERQRQTRAQQLQEATRLLQERRLGPSRTEQLLQLSAAFLQPRQYKGFGATLQNVLPVLAQQQATERQGKDLRAEELMKLQHAYQNAEAEGETASLKARADLLKIAQQANKPQWARTVDPTSGEVTLTPVYANGAGGGQAPGVEPADIRTLLTNPKGLPREVLVQFFNRRYGEGAAEKLLGE